jgi:hypothetical protein
MDRPGIERLFTEEKIQRYAWMSLFFLVAGYGVRVVLALSVDGALARDFFCFWAVSELSLAGDPAAAFDWEQLRAAQQSIGSGEKFYTWSYPPTFQLVILPLALVRPLIAQVLWAVAGAAVFAFAYKKLLPQRHSLLVVASSGVFVTNLYVGQTGIWLAALYLAGLASLMEPERRWPWGAAAFGIAAFKPHLGLLVPLTLLFSRQWAAFAMATAAFALFAWVSVLVFGVDLWWSFIDMAGRTLELLGGSGYHPHLLTTFFSALRSLGVPAQLVYPIHWLLAAAVFASAVWLMWRCRDPLLSASVAICAGLLIFPYAYYYDLMLLIGPLAVLVRDALRSGWLPGEPEALVFFWLAPFPAMLLMQISGLSLGVAFPLLALVLIGRRVRVRHMTRHQPAQFDEPQREAP